MELLDKDRDMWLSRLIDNELSADERTAVEKRITENAFWREELQRLERSTKFVEAILVKFHEDDGFAGRVTSKLQKIERRERTAEKPGDKDKLDKHEKIEKKPAKVQRTFRTFRRFNREEGSLVPMGIAAAAAILILGFIGMKAMQKNITPPPPIVKTEPKSTTINYDFQVLTLVDGTKVAARKGTEIRVIDERTIGLTGEALFFVAKSDKPFTIQTLGGKIQAYGTRFDVSATTFGSMVRVAEGVVRVQRDGGKSVEAKGGVLVTPSLETRMFDPRDMSADWRSAAMPSDSVAPWSQVLGSATHSGMSPLKCPEALDEKRAPFYAFPEKVDAPECGVAVSAQNRAYIVTKTEKNAGQLLELSLDGANRGKWRVCSTPHAAPKLPLVITPKGLVVTAALDGTIAAYDPETDRVAWTYKESSMLVGISADPREMVLITTTNELFALDARDGKLLWEAKSVKGISAPATVLPNGLICVVIDNQGVTLVEPNGKVSKSVSYPKNLLRPAALANLSGNEIWLTSSDGYIARVDLDTGEKTEKYYGWQLKCAPIASGLLGHGSMVLNFEQPAAITAPAEDTIVSIVQDGRREVFAGYHRGVLHLHSGTPAAELAHWRGVGFTNVAKGEVVKNGLAISSGRLIVTTNAGVQVFE